MTANPYLAHLIADPTFGYLFPHRLAIAAFGVANEYQLNKHRPRLIEGQHYIKIRGADHVERLFYTLIGLLALSDLIGTPQSQQFKQVLVQHTQPGGAIVQSQPAHLYAPSTSPAHLYTEPTASTYYEPEITSTYPVISQSNDPAYLVAQHLSPQIEQTIDRALTARISTQPLQPQSTAELLFQQQQLDIEKQQAWTDSLLKAQDLIKNQTPTEIHVNLWQQADSWLAKQDTWALSLIAAAVLTLTSISAYFLVSSAVRPNTSPAYSTQSWR